MQFDKDARIIYITEEINSSLGQVNFELIRWISEDDKKAKTLKEFKREPIKIYIQSHGGTICDMWSLIDIMLNSKTPIHTYCTGYASSAAFKIFLAGRKRYASKHAMFLYHQMSYMAGGTHQDVREQLDNCEFENKRVRKYVMSRTKITKKKIKEIQAKKIDWFISAKEAKELGIVNKII